MFDCLRWVVDRGGWHAGLELIDGAVVLDASTTRVPLPGEPLMRIPWSALLTPSSATAHPHVGALCTRIHDRYGEEAHEWMLATLAAFECHSLDHPQLGGYFAHCWKTAEHGSVASWPEDEIHALGSPPLTRAAVAHRKAQLRAWDCVCETAALDTLPPWLERDHWLRALFIVTARSFGRFLPCVCLVPGADQLDHLPDCGTSNRLVGSDATVPTSVGSASDSVGVPSMALAGNHTWFVLTCGPGTFTRRADGRLDVWNDYGPKPNCDLLLDYGFACLHNPHERVSLSLRHPSALDNEAFWRADWRSGVFTTKIAPFSESSFASVHSGYAPLVALSSGDDRAPCRAIEALLSAIPDLPIEEDRPAIRCFRECRREILRQCLAYLRME
jgi:hypothetical protein